MELNFKSLSWIAIIFLILPSLAYVIGATCYGVHSMNRGKKIAAVFWFASIIVVACFVLFVVAIVSP